VALGVISTSMSASPPLDRLLQRASFFPGLNVRLGSLDATRRIIEGQLDEARAAEIRRLRTHHESLGLELHSDDREAEEFELQQQVLHLLPKALRGGFLVTLWAVLERTVHDIAALALAHRGLPFSERAFHRPFFVAATDALARGAGLPAFPDTAVEQKLREVQAVRNALVHHDGRQSDFPEPYARMSAAELETLNLHLVRDYDYTYVIPGEAYIMDATSVICTFVHGAADRVFNVLVPKDA
jgi:hypothetical protein